MERKKKKRVKIALIVIASLLVVLIGGFYIYTLDYYRADETALQTISADDCRVLSQGNFTIFYPESGNSRETGIIFYPGGKVEAIAYAPLLKKLSDNGFTCVLVKMPMNLAIFGVNSANKVYDALPHIQDWYLSGHSLGGAMASSYVGNNSDKLSGLILLGAYPINDADIPTLAIYGSEDEGLDLSKLTDTQNKLEIVGGNHAYFGDYGEQEGDGTAAISRAEQQTIAVDTITAFISST